MYHPPGLSPHTAAQQRVDGAARIAWKRGADGVTRLADLYQRAPCRLLFPQVEPGEPAQSVLLTTSGGITGGDRLDVGFEVGAGAGATLTTQAAEKIYRSLPGAAPAQVRIRARVGAGAWAEWLAQETILFDRAHLRREFNADLEPGARLLAVESLVLGRAAMGERFDNGYLHDAWRIRRGGRLVWADALHLQGDIAAQRAAPFGLGTARGCATLLYVGDDAQAQLPALRERMGACASLGAATAYDGLLIVRLLADDATRLRAAVKEVAIALRELCAGLAPRLPRVWEC